MIGIGLGLGMTRGGGGASFDPLTLFEGSTTGVWYEPARLADFQESTASTVAAVNAPVGYAFDHSGNTRHATQATSGNRPTLKSRNSKLFYEFNGTSSSFVTPAINLSGTGKATIVMAMTMRSIASNHFYLESATIPSTSNPGAIRLASNTNTGIVASLSGATAVRAATNGTTSANMIQGPQTVVLIVHVDATATDELLLSWNGLDITRAKGSDSGATTLSSQTYHIGSRQGTSRWAPIDLFGFMIIDRQITEQEESNLINYWDSRIDWPGADEFDVFIVGGDSNANGAGDTLNGSVDISDGYQLATSDTGLNRTNTIRDADDPLDGSTKVGPGVAFARAYMAANPGRIPLIINAAWGGTGHSDGNWVVGGTYYNRLLIHANFGLASRPKNKLKGILWLSGTNDTGFAGDPVFTGAQWTDAMDDMVVGFRANITGGSNVPIVVGPLVPDFLTTLDNPAAVSARSAALDIQAAIDDLASVISNCAVIDPSGLSLPSQSAPVEPFHFNAAAQRVLGPAFLDAWETLV